MTAEAILYKENDPLLRYAIYKAYKYRCAYTGKFLYDYSSMHLDHIILPLKYFRKKYGNII